LTFTSGFVWREADTDTTDLDTVIKDLLSGQYNDPQRIIAFNTAEGWSEDVSETSHTSSAGAATYRTETYHLAFKTSLTGTKAAI